MSIYMFIIINKDFAIDKLDITIFNQGYLRDPFDEPHLCYTGIPWCPLISFITKNLLTTDM